MLARCSGWLGTASLLATLVTLLLALMALVPQLLVGSLDAAGRHRTMLYDSYLVCALITPCLGAGTLVFNGCARVAGIRWATTARSTWFAALAMLSGAAWLILFPFVFFATGGTR